MRNSKLVYFFAGALVALIASAASVAKARIGQGVANATTPSSPPLLAAAPQATEVPEYTGLPPTRSGAAVDFFADEPMHDQPLEPEDPAFASAVEAGGEGLPEGSIEFDNYAQEGMDDAGIPVWEEPP